MDRSARRLALLDTDAQARRRAAAGTLVDGLHVVGQRHTRAARAATEANIGTATQRSQIGGLGTVASTGGHLMRGVVTLLDADQTYGAAALVRQMVEVEYLAWAFAEDPDEAGVWMSSSKQERMARWTPKRLRERAGGRFRGQDYQHHCELGGHPTPDGLASLTAGKVGETSRAAMLADALTHGWSTWRYVITAAVSLAGQLGQEPDWMLPAGACLNVDEEVGDWWRTDAFIPFVREFTIGATP